MDSAHKITGANAAAASVCQFARAGRPHRFGSGLGKKTMSRFESITLVKSIFRSRTFYEHHSTRKAIRMAAFVCKDPKDKVAFDAHWDKI